MICPHRSNAIFSFTSCETQKSSQEADESLMSQSKHQKPSIEENLGKALEKDWKQVEKRLDNCHFLKYLEYHTFVFALGWTIKQISFFINYLSTTHEMSAPLSNSPSSPEMCQTQTAQQPNNTLTTNSIIFHLSLWSLNCLDLMNILPNYNLYTMLKIKRCVSLVPDRVTCICTK